LAQATDLAPEFGELTRACARHGIDFRPVELDDAPAVLGSLDARSTLVWTLTDGIAYYRGSLGPALARLNGKRTIGADDSIFAICQDKFRSGAVLAALGLPIPPAGLARDGVFVVQPPPSPKGWFVKPNRLGSKIGIWPDSRIAASADVLPLGQRIFAAYGDDAIVQAYVPGRNVRASFLAVDPRAGPEKLGVFFVDSGGDFQTMADSLALYGESGAAAKASGAYVEPELVPVASLQPEADRRIRAIAGRLMAGLGLRDVFSIDLRVEADDTVHLIEFEVAPGLPCFDFRDYCRRQWGMTLAEAMAATAASRFGN
ncbi:MAG: D-alanine:D-lactate ligase-like protein, partial [Rhizobiaceae bacterium]